MGSVLFPSPRTGGGQKCLCSQGGLGLGFMKFGAMCVPCIRGSSSPEGPVALSPPCHTHGIAGYSCAAGSSPSRFVGLLEPLVSQGSALCCQTLVLAQEQGQGWAPHAELRVMCSLLTRWRAFSAPAFPLTCCCSHRKAGMCVRERVEHVLEQMASTGKGVDFYFYFFLSSACIKKVMRMQPMSSL